MKITDEKIREFAKITGDDNPIHLDDEFAESSRFGRRIAHGMLCASLISAEIARKYPGAIYSSQHLQFMAPVFVDDEIEAVVTETKDDRWLYLTTHVKRGDEVVITGVGEILCK